MSNQPYLLTFKVFQIFPITNNAVINMFIYTVFLRIYFRNGTIMANIMDIYKAYDVCCWIAFPRGYNIYTKIRNA